MTGNPGDCPLCGGGKQPGATTFAVDLGFGVVVVRGVPALVCSQCGEAWIEDPVAEARRKRAVVEVRHWDQVAA